MEAHESKQEDPFAGAETAAECCCCGPSIRAELRVGSLPEGVDWRPWLLAPAYTRKRLSDKTVLLLRIFLALFCWSFLFGSIAIASVPRWSWATYLTDWTILVISCHLSLSCVGTAVALRSLGRGEPAPARPWWLPVIFTLQSIAIPAPLIVDVVFWAALMPADPAQARYAINYFVHGANLLACWSDAAWLVSTPYYFRYVWSGFFMYGVVYALWMITFIQVGGRVYHEPYIYSIFNFSTHAGVVGGGILLAILVFIIVPCLGLLTYECIRLRTRIAKRTVIDV